MKNTLLGKSKRLWVSIESYIKTLAPNVLFFHFIILFCHRFKHTLYIPIIDTTVYEFFNF